MSLRDWLLLYLLLAVLASALVLGWGIVRAWRRTIREKTARQRRIDAEARKREGE